MGTTVLLAFVAAAVAAALGVAALRRWALRRHVLDVPNHRSSHAHPVPRGGGLAFVVIGLAAAAFALGGPGGGFVLAYVAGGAAVAAVSWLDDLRGLSTRVRFGVHLVAALGLVAAVALGGGVPAVAIPLVGLVDAAWVLAPLALLWVTGLTNAYNFMDGIDGIAGVQGVVAGAGTLALAALAHWPAGGVLGAALAGGALGFLVHNWAPARIFMGDVGAAFLGFSFAALPLLGAALGAGPAAARWPVAGALLVWPFVFDTALTLVRRWRRGENLLEAHRSHLYQRLVQAGWSHARVSVLYGALALGGGALALAWVQDARWAPLVVFGPLAAGAALVVGVRRAEGRHAAGVQPAEVQPL